MHDLSTRKPRLQHSLNAIATKHRNGASGTAIALALTRRLDELITSVYTEATHKGKNRIALVALGGYGRRELNFASDTDIMFLVRTQREKKVAAGAVKEILHTLLDCGLEIGHSFRTIDECLEMAPPEAEGFDAWLSMLDARFLCGNRTVYARFRTSVASSIKKSDKKSFVRQLLAAMNARHQKYGESTTLLEPNLKNSAGGLRDLHTVLWLLRGLGKVALDTVRRSENTALQKLLRSRALRQWVDPTLLPPAARAFDVLLRTRHEMHLRAQGLHDALEFSSQRSIAEALGYRRRGERTSVELFMQDYYVAARAIDRLTQRIFHRAQDALSPTRKTAPGKVVEQSFILRDGALYPRSARWKPTSADVLRAVIACTTHGATFSASLEDQMGRHLESLKPLNGEEHGNLFRSFLNGPRGVAHVLQRLNAVGALGRLIPEWQPMVAFFQHNIYHYYTADEHTLKVIANAEGLSSAQTSFGDVFRSLPRRDTLYLACLLHDIAKPKRIGNHEVLGVKIAARILKRLHAEDIQNDVLFLIRHHLLMEQTAFRRNLGDPQTITDFAAYFRNVHQLDYLYVLTYADLSAVNKNVWSDWKGMLLYELYRKTRTVLERGLTHEEVHGMMEREYEDARRRIVRVLQKEYFADDASRHLEAVESPAYLSVFTPEEIAEHIQRIRPAMPVSLIAKRCTNVTELTIIGRDAPYALSNFCGVLTANDANILDAHIFTRKDGVIIDKFTVIDFLAKSTLTADQCRSIESELEAVQAGRTDIEHLLRRHRIRWKRRTTHHNPNVRIDVEFEDHPRFTIIDVYAPDMFGFLYRITRAMSDLGLNIAFAKIATRTDGIVDSFYATDRSGRTVNDPLRRERIRERLLTTIRELMQHRVQVEQ
jgi:[protein-PII] uridylyltransferase